MESSWLLVFLPCLHSDCLDCKYGGSWCHKGDGHNFLQKTLHRHPKRAAALQNTEPFSRDQNTSLQWELPNPSPESLHGSSCSAQPGICMAGHTSWWDCSHTLLSPALQLAQASHSVPHLPQLQNGQEDTSLCWDFGSGIQVAVFVMQYLWYTIYQQGSSSNAALLQLTLLLFYSRWNLYYQKLSCYT